MKNVNFVPKDALRILSSHKISGKDNEEEALYKKTAIKNLAIFTGKHVRRVSFLIKMQAFRPATLLKRDSNIRAFLTILRNF